jgi:hypothetical protein
MKTKNRKIAVITMITWDEALQALENIAIQGDGPWDSLDAEISRLDRLSNLLKFRRDAREKFGEIMNDLADLNISEENEDGK